MQLGSILRAQIVRTIRLLQCLLKTTKNILPLLSVVTAANKNASFGRINNGARHPTGNLRIGISVPRIFIVMLSYYGFNLCFFSAKIIAPFLQSIGLFGANPIGSTHPVEFGV